MNFQSQHIPVTSSQIKKQTIISTPESPLWSPSQSQPPDFSHHRFDLLGFKLYTNGIKLYRIYDNLEKLFNYLLKLKYSCPMTLKFPLGIYSKGLKGFCTMWECTRMFTVMLLIIAPNWKQQMHIDNRMDKWIVLCSHNGILYSSKKELQLHIL